MAHRHGAGTTTPPAAGHGYVLGRVVGEVRGGHRRETGRLSDVTVRMLDVDNPWSVRLALDLDITTATIYREERLQLGGRWLVWPDQVWWERPGGGFQRSISPASFVGEGWVLVEKDHGDGDPGTLPGGGGGPS